MVWLMASPNHWISTSPQPHGFFDLAPGSPGWGPDLEEEKNNLVVQNAKNNKILKDIEDHGIDGNRMESGCLENVFWWISSGDGDAGWDVMAWWLGDTVGYLWCHVLGVPRYWIGFKSKDRQGDTSTIKPIVSLVMNQLSYQKSKSSRHILSGWPSVNV